MSTHWKKQYNYEYMGSYSLPDGKDVVLTIKTTRKEKVTGNNGKKEECFVCYFNESDKPMILNRTNCKTITKVLNTPFIEEWEGKKIQIGIDSVSAFGESVDALRVRNVKPQQKIVDYSKKNQLLTECNTLEELQNTYLSFNSDEKAATLKTKDEMKYKLMEAQNENK